MTERGRGLAGLAALVAVACVGLLAVVGTARMLGGGSAIVVGSKGFSESWILAEIYAQRIEHVTGLAVRRRHALGGTLLAFEGLRGGSLDLYPEYTGTGLVSILGEPVPRARQTVLPRVREGFSQRWGMTWLAPQGFNNTYALAMRRTHAERLGVVTITDLQALPELVMGFATEFVARDDGWPGLKGRYELAPRQPPRAMEAGLMYQAAAAGEVDIISAYATDARIDKFDLVVLADDQVFFPPYQAAPLLGPGVASHYPQIVEALAPLAGRLDDVQMRRLNAQVDIHRKDPADVARAYLDSLGL